MANSANPFANAYATQVTKAVTGGPRAAVPKPPMSGPKSRKAAVAVAIKNSGAPGMVPKPKMY